MATARSLWEHTAWRKNNRLGLPRLESIVLPRPKLLRDVLAERLIWLVGPPKIGKTVLAHYLAYSDLMGRAANFDGERFLGFEGATECLRALDLLLEVATPSVVALVLEDPLGETGTQDHVTFIERLAALRNVSSELKIVLTSRPRPYFGVEKLLPDGLATRTPATFDEWYDPEDLLLHYAATIPDFTRELAERLAC